MLSACFTIDTITVRPKSYTNLDYETILKLKKKKYPENHISTYLPQVPHVLTAQSQSESLNHK